MKKIFSLFLCAGAFVAASAQLVISPTGMMNEIGFQAENMSADAGYACGSNQLTQQPAIWNVARNGVMEFAYRDTIYDYVDIYGTKPGWEYVYDYSVSFWEPVDSVWGEVIDYDNVVGVDTVWDVDDYTGSFHAINNAGLAVGAFGSGYGDKYAVKAMYGDAEVTYLYSDRDVEAGGDAWAVNADGSLILGFYFDGAWTTHACLWKNGGLTAADRVDLPAPTEEEFGGPIDYVAARWMSADASVILGYAQDAINGKWVMVYWTKNSDESYTVHAEFANRYFTPYWFTEDGNAYWVKPNSPYAEFEPYAISANGEWVTLKLTPQYDMNDWDAMSVNQAARLNLKTGELTVLNLGNFDAPILYGIADNGTAVGATEAGGVGPLSTLGEPMSANRVGYVWPINNNNIFTLQQLFPDETYFGYTEETGEAAISSISADASKIIGYTNQTDGIEDWAVSSFIAPLPATYPSALEHVEEVKVVKTIENGQVVIIRDGVRYNALGTKLQ